MSYRIIGYDSSKLKLPETREEWRFKLLDNPEHNLAKAIDETVAVQCGPVNLAHIPFAPRKDETNEENGIVKRLIHAQHLPKRRLVQEIRQFVKKEIIPYINPLPPGMTDEELREKWNQDNSYSAKRRQQLKELAEQHKLKYNRPTKEIMKSKMFMKEEFYEEKKHARLIISRSDTFKGIVGPYIHAFDEELFHGHFSNNFVKGKDSKWKVARMREIQSKYPLYMETDYSSFEGSQCAMIQDAVEKQVLRHFLKNYPKIWSYVESTFEEAEIEVIGQKRKEAYERKMPKPSRRDFTELLEDPDLQPSCKHADIFSKYHRLYLLGNRKSGEMWTSSGNGLLNLVIMKFLAHKKRISWDGIVEGDDGFFGVSARYIQADDYSQLGFTIKLNYETDPNMLSFCGLRFSGTGKLVVDPENLNRVGWIVKKRYFHAKKKLKLALLKAKMMSLLAEAPACPISSVLAKSVIRKIRVKPRFGDQDWWYTQWLSKEKVDLTEEVDYRTRLDFSVMFGIPVSTQIEMENSFKKDCFSNFFLPIGKGHSDWMASYEEGLVRDRAPAVIE
uniref:Gp2 n=1 Tax=Towan virus TaxID=1892900 RepID=A0A1B3Q5T8_9VIRU|nr:gp2 [Towan virus]